ncbi:MAG TPA: DUF1080 domain-containing protein [Anaerohalosphaeraceae bacterium]|nr:DUF1080 domain-containing protein [Anaerohalosphaeraceae bacterium]HOL88512.1 DUF1080 domain-containing protein [Anaerohalosphaeraceae bacterium]HPP56434.1 DUF1080 domain-containing protein [Anaerohalosphaeraceae bacterium]
MVKQAVGLVWVCMVSVSAAAQEPWKPLFNGKDLTGWQQKGGQAVYTVEDGVIVGTTVLDTPNSFLCTQQFYSDFILELEFKVDPKLNSGIQIRSHSVPEYNNGRVHGYQVEIDPSDRAWTAGIYDEARRGWLATLEKNPPARAAFRQNEWNHLRIEAVGDVIRTWINGVPAAHLSDSLTPNGFIALQVHTVGSDKSKEGIQVRWRNIRIIDENAAAYLKPMPLPLTSMDYQLGNLEAPQGWVYLFDGKTPTGWRSARGPDFPKQGWVIENGVLTVLDNGGKESAGGGDIITVERYSDFELQLEFKLSPGANSGIKYFVQPDLNKGPGSAIGLEYQLLDDLRHPDAKAGSQPGSRTLASLYDLIAADNKDLRPIGRWNHARIISKGTHVEHWLNGRKVLEYERKTPEFRKLVQESKYKIWPDFGEWDSGHILLQDHGNQVSFKNIKIRLLK